MRLQSCQSYRRAHSPRIGSWSHYFWNPLSYELESTDVETYENKLSQSKPHPKDETFETLISQKRKTCNQVTFGLLLLFHSEIKFCLQAQSVKSQFHFLALRRFHTTSLSKPNENMNTTMATYVVSLTAKRMKRGDSSIKVSPWRIYSQKESMPCGVLVPFKTLTVRYYILWSPWSFDPV